jgi:hypothetical protein
MMDANILPDGWKVQSVRTMPDGKTIGVRVVCDLPDATIGAVTGFGDTEDAALARVIEAIPAAPDPAP